jgi:transcriptional regulator with XRE-family HTH domain
MVVVDIRRAGRIREQRLAAGLSQDRLARLAGCSVSMVLAIERGYIPARSAVLPRIEQVLAALDPSSSERRPGTTPTAAKADDRGPLSA